MTAELMRWLNERDQALGMVQPRDPLARTASACLQLGAWFYIRLAMVGVLEVCQVVAEFCRLGGLGSPGRTRQENGPFPFPFNPRLHYILSLPHYLLTLTVHEPPHHVQ